MRLPPFPLPLAVVRIALAARGRLLNLADAFVPREVALFDLSWGMQRTKLVGALVHSGLADAIGADRRDPLALASELGLDADVTARVVDAACAARLMRLDRRGRARLTALGAPLRRDHPHSLASVMAYQARPVRSSATDHLVAQLHAGPEPSGFRRAFGQSLWDYLDAHPEEGAEFGMAMRELTGLDLMPLVRAYPWPRDGVICDIGGGIGTLLAAILRRRDRATGVLVEASEVLAEAKHFLASQGVRDRVELCAGDLFSDLDVRADVYVMKWVLHDWSDDACRGVLGRVRATMPPGARLVVIDQCREPGRPNSVTPMSDLHMLAVCEGGRERSPGEVHGLMEGAGLRRGRVKHSGVQMLVEGIAS